MSLIKTLTDADETMDELEEKVERAKTIVKFIFFGLFYLLLSIPVDAFVFFYNLYTFPQSQEIEPTTANLISSEALEIFKACCKECQKQCQSNLIDFTILNKMLQKELKIQDKIHSLIFDNATDDKFITDKITKT